MGRHGGIHRGTAPENTVLVRPTGLGGQFPEESSGWPYRDGRGIGVELPIKIAAPFRGWSPSLLCPCGGRGASGWTMGFSRTGEQEIMSEAAKEKGQGGVVVSLNWLQRHKTPNGGYRKAQLAALGLGWPPERGWQAGQVGRFIPADRAKAFEQGARP